jgi:hypothetical protein
LKFLVTAVGESRDFARTRLLFATATFVAEVGANRIRTSFSLPYPRDAFGTSFIMPLALSVDTTPALQHPRKWRR